MINRVESLASGNSPKTSKSQLSIGPLYHEFEMMPVDKSVESLASGNSTTALNPTLSIGPLYHRFEMMPVDESVKSLASGNSTTTSKSQLSIGPLYHEFVMMPVDELVSILSSGNFNSAINFITKIEDNLLNTSFNLNKTELISLLEKINNINASVNDTDLKDINRIIQKISNSKLINCLTDALINSTIKLSPFDGH